jgi:diguanylate cyclase (GGDEF)-like protein
MRLAGRPAAAAQKEGGNLMGFLLGSSGTGTIIMSNKILVIDDSPDIHTLVRVRLSKEQVIIESAFDGESGLTRAREIHPDLILLDVEMPGRDGFSVCTELKADAITMDVPIIFLTGAATAEDKIRGLDLGATDYITKPFDPAELRARVRASLRTRYLLELLSKKAMIDGLTGLWNRTYLDARLSAELSAARRSGQPLTCIMADIDHFKDINDAHGHRFGDDVLRAVAATFTQACRPEDVVCRYGGEEFAILMPATNVAQGGQLAERVRDKIQALSVPSSSGNVRITCSFGVGNLRGEVPPSVVELADQALYRAKHGGRNRVELCDETQRVAA